MSVDIHSAVKIIERLEEHGVSAILYGSVAASVYLGEFKKFGDIDLLVEDEWLDEKWEELEVIMEKLGFALQDLHEHEFYDNSGTIVAFAKKSILYRDKIILSSQEIRSQSVDGSTIHILAPEALRRAYVFSKRDGYRRDVRQKDDENIIKLLDALEN